MTSGDEPEAATAGTFPMRLLLDILPVWGIRDPFSAASHLVGVLLGALALLALLRRARAQSCDRATQLRLGLYGLALTLVFAASTVFHWTTQESPFLKKLDHAAIFFVIAGTSTVLYGALRRPWVRPLLGAIWFVTAVAVAVKMVVWPMPLWLTSAVYLGVSAVAAARLDAVVRAAGEGVRDLVTGAAIFVVGAVLFAAEWPVVWPGVIEGHEVFHLFTLAGAALHFRFIYAHCTLPDALGEADGEEAGAEVWEGLMGRTARQA